MVVNAFSFFDRKGGMFSPPFFFPSRGQALRVAQDLANDLGTMIGKHPADFDFFQVGQFDDASGTFAGAPDFIINCQALVERVTREDNGQ